MGGVVFGVEVWWREGVVGCGIQRTALVNSGCGQPEIPDSPPLLID